MKFNFKIQQYQTDASMPDDSVAVNLEQLFNSYSPDTTLKVLQKGKCTLK